MNKIHTSKILIAIVAITLGLVTASPAMASSKNYNAGFTDGIGDCHIDQSQWAMNLASNAGHHSSDYLAGHDAGLAACNSQQTIAVSNQNSNNVDQNNRNQAQGESNNQHVFCVNVFGSCPVTNGQSQGLSN